MQKKSFADIVKNKWIMGIAIPVVVWILVYFLKFTTPVEQLHLTSINDRLELRGQRPLDRTSEVVIIAIDDQSYESMPSRWPWRRDFYIKIIDNLKLAGARVIGIDIEFDKTSRYDTELARAIREHGAVVLAGKKLTEIGRQRGEQLVEPSDELMKADSIWGNVNIGTDRDGFTRQYTLIDSAFALGRRIPSFAFECIRRYRNFPSDVPVTVDEETIRFADYQIPVRVGHTGAFLINYYGPARTFPTYSFDTVVDDQSDEIDLGPNDDDSFDSEPDTILIAPEDRVAGKDSVIIVPPGLLQQGVFKDKIVLIGATFAEAHDTFQTPFLEYEGKKMEMPGVEIHANAIKTILDKNFIYKLSEWLEEFLILIVSLIAYLSITFLKPLRGFIVILIEMIGYSAAALYLLVYKNLLILTVAPTLAIFLSYTINVVLQYIIERREKKMIRGIFSTYLTKSVVDELIKNPHLVRLGGEKRIMTALFSDVAGFTTISEQLTPEELVKLLNEYLTEMTRIVLQYEGVLDKYEGDAVMAFFGAPVEMPDHALRACHVSLDMQKSLIKLREKWRTEKRPELRARIGLNSGPMIVGNMGSEERLDYTVMGDAVNLASRLEGANKEYGSYIMIGPLTYELAKEGIITRQLDSLRVKGKKEPVKVYELLARKEDGVPDIFRRLISLYDQGMEFYKEQKWDLSIDAFQSCLKEVANDGPSKVYLDRCLEFKANPPGKDWDGVFTMTHK